MTNETEFPTGDESHEEAGDAPGWNAITDAVTAVYGDLEPVHVGTLLGYRLGGPDPLDGISAFAAENPPHWHFITYGFSELFDKESDDAEVSGFGIELTFRLARPDGEQEPPSWAFNFLQNLARYVFQTGNVFAAGHFLNAQGPIAVGTETDLKAVLFVADPELPAFVGPFGRVEFVQVVGITLDELDAATNWDSMGMVEFLMRGNPKLVSDLGRASILRDSATAADIQARSAKEGSSQAGTYTTTPIEWHPAGKGGLKLELGALGVEGILRMIDGRTRHGREFHFVGKERALLVQPGSKNEWRVDEAQNLLVLTLAPDFVPVLRGDLKAERGRYAWPQLPNFTISVVPTDILDNDGNVVRTVG